MSGYYTRVYSCALTVLKNRVLTLEPFALTIQLSNDGKDGIQMIQIQRHTRIWYRVIRLNIV